MTGYDRKGSGRKRLDLRIYDRRDDKGLTLLEVLVVMAIMAIVAAIGVSYSSGWIRREKMRSAAYILQTHMQMARVEALSRNRDCRFILDTSDSSIQVLDLNDPSDSTDDILIATTELPTAVSFARPDTGAAITLNNSSGTLWETTFRQDGVVSSGNGSVHIAAEEFFRKISVYVAGGVQLQTWNDGSWMDGA